MTLCCVVFKIFNVEQYRDLDFEIQLKGQSQSLKVVPSDIPLSENRRVVGTSKSSSGRSSTTTSYEVYDDSL